MAERLNYPKPFQHHERLVIDRKGWIVQEMTQLCAVPKGLVTGAPGGYGDESFALSARMRDADVGKSNNLDRNGLDDSHR